MNVLPRPDAANAIEVRHLVKSYRDTVAVRDVSFSVEQGEIFGILGPNGSGKTTTVESLQGLRTIDSGEVSVLGLPVAGGCSSDPGQRGCLGPLPSAGSRADQQQWWDLQWPSWPTPSEVTNTLPSSSTVSNTRR